MNDDNGAGLRALFYGLCSFWDISIRAAEDPDDPSDFTLRALSREPVYVVILPEPADRQVEIGALLSYGNLVLVLDDWDLNTFRACRNKVRAAAQLHQWISSGGTHAAAERRRLGIAS